jgi:hypothetical protein
LSRIILQAREGGFMQETLSSLHALLPALALDGAGQFAGYLLGTGNAQQRVADFEFRRFDHITAADRRQLFGEEPIQ